MGDPTEPASPATDPTETWPSRFGSGALLVGSLLVLAVLAAIGVVLWHAFVRAGLFAAGERSLGDVVAFTLLLLGAALLAAGIFFLLVEAKQAPAPSGAPAGEFAVVNVTGRSAFGFPVAAPARRLLDATEGRRPSFVLLVLGVVLVLMALVSSGLVEVSVGDEGGTTTTTTEVDVSGAEEDGG